MCARSPTWVADSILNLQIDWVDCLLGLDLGGDGRILLAHQQAPSLVYQCTSTHPSSIHIPAEDADREEIRAALYVHRFHEGLPLTRHSTDIVRILFMVPLYALISTASYFWWVSTAVLSV